MFDIMVGTPVSSLNVDQSFFVNNNINYILMDNMSDIHFDDYGLLVMTNGEKKVSQNIILNLLTETGTIYPEAIGSDLKKYIGEKVTNKVISEIGDTVIKCIETVNDYNIDNYDKNEYLYSIDNVDVYNDENDPRQINISISVTTADGDTINVILGLA